MYGHWSLCSSCISVSQLLNRDFLKYLEFISLLAFAKDFVILGGHTFNTQNGSLQCCLDFHFLFMWHLKVSQSESLGFSQIFLEHVHSPIHAYALLDFQEWSDLFKAFYGHLILQFFFLSCLVRFLFVPTLIIVSGSGNVKQLLLIVFDKCSQGKDCSH